MNAEIIAVGTELLLGQIVNTNAQFLSQELASLGIGVYYQTVVGDNVDRLRGVFAQALDRADVVILTGGLGPTTDDLTREAVAGILGRELQFSDEVWQAIVARMQRFSRRVPENNRRQAFVPAGATILPNPNGTAPGVAVEHDGKLIALLPGPPREMQPMFRDHVRPLLLQGGEQAVIHSTSLRIIGIGESALEELIGDLIAAQSNPTIALYAKLGEVEIRITARAEDIEAANELIRPTEQQIRLRLGSAVYGVNQETLPAVLGQLLLARGWQLAVAESCTGGLISSMITSVAGSSAYFNRGMITYSNQAKVELLGVSVATIESFGAVSAECAREMAAGARNLSGCDVSIAVTGMAGPGGGTAEKPVGTIFVAIQTPEGELVEKLSMTGDRSAIQERTAKTAINLTRLLVMGKERV